MSKIAFFNLNRLSYEGGAENYIAEVGTALAKRGHDVYYVGDFRSLLKLFPFIGLVLRIISYKNAKSAQRDLERLPSMRKNTNLIKKIDLNMGCFIPFHKKNRYIKEFLDSSEIIFIKNEIIDMIFFYLIGRKFFQKSNLIVFTSIYYPEEDLRSKVHNFFYAGFLYKWLLKQYAGVIVSNKYEQELIPKKFHYPSKKIYYIPYGLELTEFKPLNVTRTDSKFRILFVGRLEKQKGVHYLEELIAMLSRREEFSQMEFTIAGSGPMVGIPLELSKKYENIHYLGLVPKENMEKLYNDHDIVIVPSVWETFSYVCLEAQSCSIPVVAFNTPGPNEIIVDKMTGRIVPLGDLEAFEEAIIELFLSRNHNPTSFKKMKEKAREHVTTKFSMERVTESLESLPKRL